MNHFKSFLLGVGVAYGVYYITRKTPDGTSILEELLDDPKYFFNKAKDYAVAEIVDTVKEHIS